MKILVLGSGGREHAIAWKIAQSERLTKLFVAPGNAGTATVAENIPIDPDDFEAIKKLVIEKAVDMVIVGPEAPLVNGISDFFSHDDELSRLMIIGPGKQGARLEGSKDFAKQFMARHKIPTAQYKTFKRGEYTDALEYLREHADPPYVLKADGLAAGKGVSICQHFNDAREHLQDMLLENRFGEASSRVVIEQYLDGVELSVFVVTDGESYKILPAAKDYKRIGEGDTGPNTGGMGAVSPVPFADNEFMSKVEDRVIKPTIKGLKEDNIRYKGFIFFGLMNVKGNPYVVEYNVRLGDPETEAVLPRLKSDMIELLEATWHERLEDFTMEIDPKYALTVIIASGGYPGKYEKGKIIEGIQRVEESLVFQAGTKISGQNKLITNGGRVLAVTGMADDLVGAMNKAYQSINMIRFDDMYYRTDIGQDLTGK